MTENLFHRFVYECEVYGDGASTDECYKIFVVCNLESGGETKATAKANDARSLMRFEFMESIIRIAVARFSAGIPAVSECVEKLSAECIEPNLPPEACVDPDQFRRERLYNEDVDTVLKTCDVAAADVPVPT